MLRRLAIFVGGFTLEAAQAVAIRGEDMASDIIRALADLVAKSLISVNSKERTPIYRLLDTTRAYAMEKLVESGELAATARSPRRTLSRGPGPRRRRCGDHGAQGLALDLRAPDRQRAKGHRLGLLGRRRSDAGRGAHRGRPAALDAPVAHERVPVTRRPVVVGVDLARTAQSPPGTPVPACAGCRAPQHRGVRSGDRDRAERSAEDRRGSQRYRLQAPCAVVPMVPRPQLRRLPRSPGPRRPVLRSLEGAHAILSIP